MKKKLVLTSALLLIGSVVIIGCKGEDTTVKTADPSTPAPTGAPAPSGNQPAPGSSLATPQAPPGL